MSFSEMLTYCKNVMPKVAQNACWARCCSKKKHRKNMDNEKERTFQVGGYPSLSKVEKHFLLIEV